jgi:hypothetical protein
MDTIKKILLILTAIIYLWIGFGTITQAYRINPKYPAGKYEKVIAVEGKISKKAVGHFRGYLPLIKNISIEKLYPLLRRTNFDTDRGIEGYAKYFFAQNNLTNTLSKNIYTNKAPPFFC